MRLIGILIVVVVIAYLAIQNMGVENTSDETLKVQSQEMINQAQQSVDDINQALQKQKKALDD